VPYQEHPVFQPPPNLDQPIWRYMTFTKLVSLLLRSELYFSRTDLLDDRFEGSYALGNIRTRPDAFREAGIPEELIPSFIADEQTTRRTLGRLVYVNCWTASDHESVALWHMYSSMTQGVSLRSTFRRLTESVRAYDSPIYAGLVRYINYDADAIPEGNLFSAFVHKRRAYQFENEVRAVIHNFPRSHDGWVNPAGPQGMRVPVHLVELLERIHIAPAAPPWFAELVQTTVDRLASQIVVTPSAMKRDPSY
jgi:hypothetical protein